MIQIDSQSVKKNSVQFGLKGIEFPEKNGWFKEWSTSWFVYPGSENKEYGLISRTT